MSEFPTRAGNEILKQNCRTQQNHLAPETLNSPQQQYLSFSLDEQWYALSVYHLVEILPPPKISRVPNVPDHILGVMNLRGEVLSAIALKRFFGLPHDKPPPDSAILVVEQDGVRTGLLVDAIGDIVNLDPNNLTEEPILAGKSQPGFFEGAARCGDVLLSVIRLEGLLQSEGMYSSSE